MTGVWGRRPCCRLRQECHHVSNIRHGDDHSLASRSHQQLGCQQLRLLSLQGIAAGGVACAAQQACLGGRVVRSEHT